MTAEEKAKELIEKMMPLVYCYASRTYLTGDIDEETKLKNAKEAALIVATQTQLEFEATMSLVSNTDSDVILDKALFWGDVFVAIKAYGRVSRRVTKEDK